MSQSARGALIAEWQFDGYTGGVFSGHNPEYGSQSGATATASGVTLASITGTTLNQNAASTPNYALRMSTGVGGGTGSLILHVSGIGLSSFQITYASQDDGNRTQTWAWSTDGVNYTALAGGTRDATSASWTTTPLTVDFSSVTALNGAANVYFQNTIVFGNNQRVDFDNISITAVPEPVHYALAVFGLLFVSTGVGRWYHERVKRA